GNPLKFGLPHSVVTYLNGGNGYSNNVNGLYQLANDVLGGANTAVNPLEVQLAIAAINSAFDGCRILTGTIAYVPPQSITKDFSPAKEVSLPPSHELIVTAYPNPSASRFNIIISGRNQEEQTVIQVIDAHGRVIETRNVSADSIVRFGEHYRPGAYFVRIMQGKRQKDVKLIKLSD
ncbi:MAG TPA: T9SS type A sorting domain-containing protein, partial [Chitinophagaceae bacterium]|nr:T9SS type A sorting domain-containing protein [Chitinophagaceae bacterium]